MIQFRLLKTENDWKQWCVEHTDRTEYGDPESYPCIIGFQSIEYTPYNRRFEYSFAYDVVEVDIMSYGFKKHQMPLYVIGENFGE